ncbi:MAG: PHB depolymerase family esterase [candidate division WOR-3 bacterium]
MRPEIGPIFAGGFALVLVLVLVGTARAQGAKSDMGAGDQLCSLTFEGRKRTFLVHIPPQTAGLKNLPLVIVLHGGGGNGRAVARLTGFSALADEKGFIVVYPDAVNGHWNDGRQVRQFRSQRENVDDVGFIAALIDSLAKRLKVDPKRVYATGISNGAIMCHRLGCELASRLAAIAPVAGAIAEPLNGRCQPARPVSVVAINGTEDRFVPYEGGGVGLLAKRGRVVSVAQTIEFWVRANGCSTRPIVNVRDIERADGMRIRQERYLGGREGSEVMLFTIEGGGHTWPGGAERPRRFGPGTRGLDATREIWEFFSHHRR